MTTSSRTSPSSPPVVTLDPQGGYLTFINTFMVEPENAERLLEVLKTATQDIFRYQPGFLSVSLHMSLDRRRITNYAQWRAKEDYAAMSKNPDVQEHMKKAAALATSFDPVDYELRDVVLAG